MTVTRGQPTCKRGHNKAEHMRRRKTGTGTYCKRCVTEKSCTWGKENRAERQFKRWKRVLLNQYGLWLIDYTILYLAQQGKCAICQTGVQIRGPKTHLDHCHKTGKIRGILCNSCNLSIGMLKDSPEVLRKAASYLERATG